MRKKKCYFGQRKVKHTFGIDLNGRRLWVVPRVLRPYFHAECEKMLALLPPPTHHPELLNK
ncbi:hypothetical protein D3C80_835480 [compost metagenome]|jgi:hypothetical protein